MVVDLKGGFKTLWLRFDDTCRAPHQLFYREHSVRCHEAAYPKGRTLFLLNVPPWATSDALKKSVSKICRVSVKSVTLTKETAESATTPSMHGFCNMFIVFEKESGLEKALSALSGSSIALTTSDDDETSTVGLKKWCQDYSKSVTIDESSIKEEIEEYMRNYDEKIAALADKNINGEMMGEDDEGWTTVTARKKRGKFATARRESTIGKIRGKEESKKLKKELLNFYTFQIRQSKKQNLVELRKKFELDKEKLQRLRTKRAFKPF